MILNVIKHISHQVTDCVYMTAKYEPVHANWTTERCAVCRWVEDWDYNKIIICIRFDLLLRVNQTNWFDLSILAHSVQIWSYIPSGQIVGSQIRT